MKKLIWFFAAFSVLCTACGSGSSSTTKTIQFDKATYKTYLGFSSSSVQSGSSGAFYYVETINFWSLKDAYTFLETKVTFNGDGLVPPSYTLPSSGALTMSYNTRTFSSVSELQKNSAIGSFGSVRTISGKVTF